jgi:hypothetical protein
MRSGLWLMRLGACSDWEEFAPGLPLVFEIGFLQQVLLNLFSMEWTR